MTNIPHAGSADRSDLVVYTYLVAPSVCEAASKMMETVTRNVISRNTGMISAYSGAFPNYAEPFFVFDPEVNPNEKTWCYREIVPTWLPSGYLYTLTSVLYER